MSSQNGDPEAQTQRSSVKLDLDKSSAKNITQHAGGAAIDLTAKNDSEVDNLVVGDPGAGTNPDARPWHRHPTVIAAVVTGIFLLGGIVLTWALDLPTLDAGSTSTEVAPDPGTPDDPQEAE